MTEPDFEKLSAYLDGELAPDEAAAVEKLLQESPEWQSARERLEHADALLRQSQESPSRSMTPVGGETRLRTVGGSRSEVPVSSRVLLVTAALFVLAAVLCAIYWWVGRTPPQVATISSASGNPPGVTRNIEPGLSTEAHVSTEPTPPESPVPEVGAEAPEATPAEEETNSLPLVLTGTVLGQSPSAVIRNTETNTQKVYRIGQEILPGVTLKAVDNKSILLDRNGEEVRLTIGALSMEAPPPRTVNGLWRLVVSMNGQNENYDDLLTFKQDGRRLSVTDESGQPFAQGTIEDNDVMLQFNDGDNVYVLQGTLEHSWDKLVLRFAGATPYGDSIDPSTIELRLTRMNDEDQTRLARLESMRAEVKRIRDALLKYADDHSGRFPVSLAQLVPDYLPSVEDYANTDNRHVVYTAGQSRAAFGTEPLPPFDDFQPYRPYGERLKAYDELLRLSYGGEEWLNPSKLLAITYREPAAVFTITTRGETRERVKEPSETRTSTGPNEGEINAWITEDQDNLRQLGIILRMFQNEHKGYTPGGWASVYPEYLTDARVLTNPKDDPGTDSYLFLYPATNLDDLVAREAGNPNVWDTDPETARRVQAQIPILLDRTDFPGKEPGRNVLFLDWQVRYVPTNSDEWRQNVEPHVRRAR